MTLFQIVVTAFFVIFVAVYIVSRVKYFRTRVRGRGPFGMFAQPRHTFAQYDDEGKGEGIDSGGEGAKTGRNDSQNSS